jgi:6-pyruvoyltetrahydropterin/6-carboxytetrahydropterin synthase
MSFEIAQRFFFEAAHTLDRTVTEEAEGSRRIHGHTYQAEVAVVGEPDAVTGMVVDLAHLRAAIAVVRDALDHRLLDEVPGLGAATLENLCRFIARAMGSVSPPVCRVKVWREASGDSCTFHPPPPS